MKDSKAWFESWFDSPYYHILYKDRDMTEAEGFIDHLMERLHLPQRSKILDLGCGKGRHSVYLNRKGYDIIGIDLSKENISHCKQYENERLHFYEHDMRKIFRTNYFDGVVNLFTSFGYFAQQHQNELPILAAAKSLNKGGYLVVDFLNAHHVLKQLPHEEMKEINGIKFNIRKKVENDFITKEISFSDKGNDYSFREEVRVLLLEDFHQFYMHAGLEIINIYGDYHLNEFKVHESPRLIMITRKI